MQSYKKQYCVIPFNIKMEYDKPFELELPAWFEIQSMFTGSINGQYIKNPEVENEKETRIFVLLKDSINYVKNGNSIKITPIKNFYEILKKIKD